MERPAHGDRAAARRCRAPRPAGPTAPSWRSGPTRRPSWLTSLYSSAGEQEAEAPSSCVTGPVCTRACDCSCCTWSCCLPLPGRLLFLLTLFNDVSISCL